jgi:hypothetical protein
MADTSVEMAMRHVRLGRDRLAKQEERVRSFASAGAISQLLVGERTLILMREILAQYTRILVTRLQMSSEESAGVSIARQGDGPTPFGFVLSRTGARPHRSEPRFKTPTEALMRGAAQLSKGWLAR